MPRPNPVPFVAHAWADDDPTKPIDADRMLDIEDGIFDAHHMPSGRIMARSRTGSSHASIVEPGSTSEGAYTASQIDDVYDEWGWHPGAGSTLRGGRVRIGAAGVYLTRAAMTFDFGAADTGPRFICISKNSNYLAGTEERTQPAPDVHQAISVHVGLWAKGDIFTAWIYQASGSTKSYPAVPNYTLSWTLLSLN